MTGLPSEFSRLYLGLDLAICLIGLFALIEILKKAELKPDRLKLDTSKIMDDGKITKDEYKRMARPALLSSIIGVIIGIIPGTGASMASWFSYDVAKNMSRHKEEFGHGSVEGIAAGRKRQQRGYRRYTDPASYTRYPGRRAVSRSCFPRL